MAKLTKAMMIATFCVVKRTESGVYYSGTISPLAEDLLWDLEMPFSENNIKYDFKLICRNENFCNKPKAEELWGKFPSETNYYPTTTPPPTTTTQPTTAPETTTQEVQNTTVYDWILNSTVGIIPTTINAIIHESTETYTAFKISVTDMVYSKETSCLIII